jgi:hypothetical protein
MSVSFRNYLYTYASKSGKPIFSPNEEGRRIGSEVLSFLEPQFPFDKFMCHLKPGGHVAALHQHRENMFFIRTDLKNFFYSISKNRVSRVLEEAGVARPGYYAQWSCVKNPYSNPRYALPYGFVQSPALATLVLSRSCLGQYLRDISRIATVSVFVDDIAISSNDEGILKNIFTDLTTKISDADFQLNGAKTIAPTSALKLFNCDLEFGRTVVTDARIALFENGQRSNPSKEAFDRYCRVVEIGNL